MKESMREIFWQALEAKIGVEVEATDTAVFKRKFYSERAKAREEGINDFDCLQLISPPADTTNKLWIVHDKANPEESDDTPV